MRAKLGHAAQTNETLLTVCSTERGPDPDPWEGGGGQDPWELM